MSRFRRVAGNAALVVASVALGVAAVEAGLRLLHPQPLLERTRGNEAGGPLTRRDPELGWALKPEVSGVAGGSGAEADVATNAAGFRDVAHADVKAPGAFRVVVLGDSFVFGSGVAQDATLTRRLAARLGPGFEIVNLGVPGYGTDQELLTLRRWGRRLAPDLVLLGFFWNDVMENASAEIYGLPKPRFTLDNGALVLHPPAGASPPGALQRLDAALGATSHLWSLLRNGLSAARARSEDRPVSIDLSLKEPPSSRAAEFRLTFALLGAVRDEAASLGAPLLVFSEPPRFLVDDAVAARLLRIYGLSPDALETDGFRRVREACEERKIAFLDLLPGFRKEAASGARLFLPAGIHWSAAGHDAAAALLAPAVRGDAPLSSPAPASPTARTVLPAGSATGSSASAR